MSTAHAATDDKEHLRLLSIFHYVVGAFALFLACFPLIHIGLGLAMIYAPQWFSNKPGDEPPAFVGWLFTCMGAGMFLVGLSLAFCILLAGRFIAQRKRYWFVFIVGCFECAIFPFGTALGVFTIVVLSRPTVKSLFGDLPPPSIAGPVS